MSNMKITYMYLKIDGVVSMVIDQGCGPALMREEFSTVTLHVLDRLQ